MFRDCLIHDKCNKLKAKGELFNVDVYNFNGWNFLLIQKCLDDTTSVTYYRKMSNPFQKAFSLEISQIRTLETPTNLNAHCSFYSDF